MTDPTRLDRAHAAMRAAPDNDAARLRFYERLADAELFLMLSEEPEDRDILPEVFEVAGVPHVLAFDLEERLAAFAGRPAPYVAVSGRTVARMLAGQGAGLGLNLGVRASETVLPPEAVSWLADTLTALPRRIAAQPVEVAAPRGLPEALLSALDQKLAAAAGLAPHAWLAQVRYADGTEGHMLAFADTRPGAEDALARACGEALAFSGIEEGAIDVAFLPGTGPVAERLARVALRFDLPEAAADAPRSPPAPPGSDPTRPPKLR